VAVVDGVVGAGGGGSGRATGGFFLPQAPTLRAAIRIAITAKRVCLISLRINSQ
jgi:hypothetical protein